MNVKTVLSWCTHFDKCFPAHSPCYEYVNNIWGWLMNVGRCPAPARPKLAFRYRICLVALPQLGGKFWIKLRCCGFKISLQKCWGESWVSSGGWRPGNCAVSPWQLVPGRTALAAAATGLAMLTHVSWPLSGRVHITQIELTKATGRANVYEVASQMQGASCLRL